MKTLLICCCAALIGCLASAQPAWVEHNWRITLHVVDEEGLSIPGADAIVGYYSNSLPVNIKGSTDTNGFFPTSHVVGPSPIGYEISFSASKDGFYPTRIQQLEQPNNDPSLWNQTTNLVLKRVGKPIPMYGRKAQIELPVLDKPAGFDLLDYDWVAPYGSGRRSDIRFQIQRRWVNRRDFNASLSVSFPDSHDGLLVNVVSPVEGSSGPRIPTASPSFGFIPEFNTHLSNSPDAGMRDDNQKQDFYLRVRTVLNQDGSIKSALYGKIYGGFEIDPINSKTAIIVFNYYLNPTSNSLNVEFDPKNNLFGRLPDLQQVTAP